MLRPREPEGEHGLPRFVGDVHGPVVAGPELCSTLAVAKHLAAGLQGFSADGGKIGKLRSFVIRVVPAVTDVEEVTGHRLSLLVRRRERTSLSAADARGSVSAMSPNNGEALSFHAGARVGEGALPAPETFMPRPERPEGFQVSLFVVS